MQDKKMKTEIVLLAVPAEMLLEAGIFEGDPMQMYVDGRKLVIENLPHLFKGLLQITIWQMWVKEG